MVKLKRNLLSVSLASAVTFVATGAYAQSAQEPVGATTTTAGDDAVELDRVRVVGIRRGIEDAIETKQSSTSIVEAISAEDIGKLPDTSIADSLARLPGLTAQRFGNRPQEINIRGFAGDFSTTLLNGREQVSLGNNRGVEFDQYPSELISQVIVYKTPDASLIGQGLSGTVDLQTVRPLSYDDRVVAANIRGDINTLDGNKERGSRYSLSYVDQFADNTVGLALGYAHLNNPQQGQQFEAWGYDGGTLFGGGKLYDFQNDNTRDGLMGVLEFRPNQEFHSVLDIFYSKFDKDETKRGMEFGTAFGGATLVSRTNNANGVATQARWTGVRPVIRNDFNSAQDDLFSLGWNNELILSENWTMRADVGHSSATRNERILETYAGLSPALRAAGDSVNMKFNPKGYFDFDFGLDYGNPAILRLTDAGGWGQDGYIKDFEVKDSLTSVRFDFERSFDSGAFSTLEFGVNLTDRTKSRGSNENFLCLVTCRDGAALPIPANLQTGSRFGFATVPGIVGYDALAAFDTIYRRNANTNNGDINNKNWSVNERVATAYLQASFNTDLGSVPVRGNIGVQAVNVDQNSEGVSTFEGVTLDELATRGASYTDYLPSLNVAFELPAEQKIRFAAARQVARPRMDDLRANAGYGINRTPPGGGGPIWGGGGGNSELLPWLADAYDLSYEKYFGTKAYVSAAYFYKNLKSYIYNQTTQFDFSQLPVPPNVLPLDRPASPIGNFEQPVNGEGGKISGWELAASVPFDLLWQPLEGFGFVGSYSDTSSSIQPLGPTQPNEPLPGLSEKVYNASLYYERYGFSARVSQRHRSEFLGEVQGFGGDRERIRFGAESVIDAQLGYAFQAGSLEGLSLLLQMNNIRNEPFTSTFDGNSNTPRQYFGYGRTLLFGANYRF